MSTWRFCGFIQPLSDLIVPRMPSSTTKISVNSVSKRERLP